MVAEAAPLHAVPPLDSPVAAPDWGPTKRILFRFAFSYFFLYYGLAPLTTISLLGPVIMLADKPWSWLVPWTGRQLFGVEIADLMPNGSGDRTYGYVRLFCCLVLGVAAALVWTLLDRRRKSYPRLHEGLRIFLRFTLSVALLSYGAYKVIPSQFPAPTLDRLLQPFGDASPMGLLWTFMGASLSYNVFTGAVEMLGGLLVAFRRTTLLGALVAAGAMGNVVMLNFAYDVPVKLYSLHLFLTAVFLALPDLGRLANLFLFNRPVEPVPERPLFARRWLDRGALVVRTLFVGYVTVMALQISYRARTGYGDLGPRSPFYGIWNVAELETDGRVRPPLVTDTSRWHRVVFDRPGTLAIQTMDGHRVRYGLDPQAGPQTDDGVFALTKRGEPGWSSRLSYRRTGPEGMVVQGTFDGQKVRAVLRRTDPPEFLLTTRGFHWINEYPFNR
jgi:hypothetical protein